MNFSLGALGVYNECVLFIDALSWESETGNVMMPMVLYVFACVVFIKQNPLDFRVKGLQFQRTL